MAVGDPLLLGLVAALSPAAAAQFRVSTVSTRLLFAIVFVSGLMLLVLSRLELSQVREYRREVKAAHQLSAEQCRKLVKIATQRGGLLLAPSPESVLEGLDSVDRLERGWRIVCGIGAVLSATGVIGILVGCKCRMQPGGANPAAAGNGGSAPHSAVEHHSPAVPEQHR
jgi:hypothetical protein